MVSLVLDIVPDRVVCGLLLGRGRSDRAYAKWRRFLRFCSAFL